MPDCVALAITTPVGTIVHTGDFKIDQTPIDGEHFDLHRFAELGAQGVLALFADSTNIDRQGFTGPEIEVIDAFEEIFTSTRRQAGRRDVLVEHLPHAGARRSGGAVRAQGRVRRPQHGAERRDRAAARLSCAIPSGMQIRDTDVPNYASQDVLCIATGSQGEPQAALSRIAIDDHRYVKLGARRHRRVLGARDSRQREGDRPHDEPHRAARRRRRHRRT